jgi:hypothetical protein
VMTALLKSMMRTTRGMVQMKIKRVLKEIEAPEPEAVPKPARKRTPVLPDQED